MGDGVISGDEVILGNLVFWVMETFIIGENICLAKSIAWRCRFDWLSRIGVASIWEAESFAGDV